MNEEREARDLDARLHAYLDGELSPSDAAAFERDLRTGTTLWNRLKTLQYIEARFQATRPRAPSSLGAAVEKAITPEESTTPFSAATPSLPPRSSRWGRVFRGTRPRWVWAPAAAAAVALIVYALVPAVRNAVRPGGLSPSPERAALPTAESPASAAMGRTSTGDSPSQAAPNAVRYEFRFRAAHAREVCLAGDFNRWRVCDTPLRRVGEDVWSVSLLLPPGRYEYMFVVDGKWVTDPNAVARADDGFGNENALLVI